VIAEVLGAFLFDFLMAPAEWLSERVWRRHRKEPWWWRAISATVRSVVTVLIYLAWLAILIGVPLGIYLLVSRGG